MTHFKNHFSANEHFKVYKLFKMLRFMCGTLEFLHFSDFSLNGSFDVIHISTDVKENTIINKFF